MVRAPILSAAVGALSFVAALVFAVRDLRPAPGVLPEARPKALAEPSSPAEHGAPVAPLEHEAGSAPLSFQELAMALGVYDLAPGWGLSWCDVDGDGDPDLFVSNHLHYPSYLYINEGGFRFRRSDSSLGEQVGLDDHLGVWADVDADGRPDLYTANGFHRADHLMFNRGGAVFEDVSAQYGLVHGEDARGRSALWADLNGDHWLDLMVFSFLTPDLLYLRQPGAGFEPPAEDVGIDNSLLKEGGIAGDVDGDGDLDIYLPVLMGRFRNALYLNRGDAVFVEASRAAGVDVDGASYSAAFGDYDNDGHLDLFVARSDGAPDRLLRNRGDGTFEFANWRAGIRSSGAGMRTAGFADFDSDGFLDIFIVAGGEYDEPNELNLLFRNNGDGTFREEGGPAGLANVVSGNGSSFATADYNLDGYPDIAVTNGGGARAICGPQLFYRNAGGAAHSLSVLPRGRAGNSLGFGAHVRVRRADGVTLHREAGGIRILAQDDAWVHAGLGPEEYAQEVRVRWIGGATARLQGVPAGERLVITEDAQERFVESHPAALLGDVPSFDLEAAAERARQRLGSDLPEPDADDLARREERLLAWARARELALAVPAADEPAFQDAWSTLRVELGNPRRYWIDHAALGKFTEFARQPGLLREQAASVAAGLAAGRDLLEVFHDADVNVRAWARVFVPGSAFEPANNLLDETERGYFESGWMTDAMLEEHFGVALARRIRRMEPGEVLGPNGQTQQRDQRDLQDPERTWDLVRVVRMGAKEVGTWAQLGTTSDDVQRSLWRDALAQAFGDVPDVPDARAPDSFRGVPYDRANLAGQARAARIGERPDVQAALRRVRLEARLERGIRRLADAVRIENADVLALVERRREGWTRPTRIACTRFFCTEAALAYDVQKRLSAGESVAAVAAELSVPPITDRDARAAAYREENAVRRDRHFEYAVVDEARWARTVSSAPFDEIAGCAPGDVSSVLQTPGGYFVFVVGEHFAPEELAPERARSLARTELRRAAIDALVDAIVGF